MLLELSCELCGSAVELYTKRDTVVPPTYKCSSCSLVQLRLPTEEKERWRSYYLAGGRYHQERVLVGYDGFADRMEHDLVLARARIENLTRFAATGRLLDVGASNGALIAMAQEYGFAATGIEPDQWVVDRGAPGLLCAVFEQWVPSVNDGKYAVVCFIDSFEHLLCPHEVLDSVWRILADGGLLVMEMPDADCPNFHGPTWKHFKPREHAYLYGKSHTLPLLRRHGFRVLDTIVPYPDRRAYYAAKMPVPTVE